MVKKKKDLVDCVRCKAEELFVSNEEKKKAKLKLLFDYVIGYFAFLIGLIGIIVVSFSSFIFYVQGSIDFMYLMFFPFCASVYTIILGVNYLLKLGGDD